MQIECPRCHSLLTPTCIHTGQRLDLSYSVALELTAYCSDCLRANRADIVAVVALVFVSEDL